MTQVLARPVVVGVDGSDDASRAVRFAVREAERFGCGVRLVHAVYDVVPVYPGLLSAGETLAEVGRRLVTQAAAEVDRLSGGRVPSETVVKIGPTVSTVLQAAADARLVVLGHRDLGVLGRIFTGRTTVGVAARAECPVISVSESWREDMTFGWVAVGVDGSSASREVLAAALDATTLRGAALRVVHAWRLPPAYTDLLDVVDYEAGWRVDAQRALETMLAGFREDYPDVQVEFDLRYARTADALVDASQVADLLVVSRHGHGGRLAGITGMPVGSTARAVLAHAQCPLMIAPHHNTHHETHDALKAELFDDESADALVLDRGIPTSIA